MALLFSDYRLTLSIPKSPSMLMTFGLGLSGSAALLEVPEGAAVVAVAVLPSRGELPTGALSVPSPGIVTGVNAHSRRQMVT